ncbi:hypothetical protein Taro_032001 [Colocasia esculenta]|uniref:Cellulose synthase-like protein G3 n=1 Tax=Colocasia esculenta TaxID=4460 RepID=A0A843W845_COLES|nr:hypothetical protein [Colocasia esculenta]
MAEEGKQPLLNAVQVDPLVHLNRAHAVLYACAILALLYHRLLSMLGAPTHLSFLLFLSLTIADLVFAFKWVLTQAFRWRPVRRREFPERLASVADRKDWPALDVFICTADPYKEPPMTVVNTALSVMGFDYPANKLSVYVSDDGGSQLTLFAFMEAARFARYWLPFCRENGLVDRSPEAYFSSSSATHVLGERCEKIKVLLESSRDADIADNPLPNLIYVSREKRRNYDHHFKAGALNVLIRVSGEMSNAPVVLTLDCDMYSNDPQTPQRALCYLLDHNKNAKLAFVQFPQRFKGINEHDIYGSELKRLFQINPVGMDGFRGPSYVGSGSFFSRCCFHGSTSLLPQQASQPVDSTGSRRINLISSEAVLANAHRVASCSYEHGTKWGYKVGMRYGSLVEDYNTGYRLHCEGWESVFCNPQRPAFLGDVPTNFSDSLNQTKRWCIGLLEVAFSKYCPLSFGCKRASLPMGLHYAHYAFWGLWCIPLSIYAILPQVTLAYGVPLFPKAFEPWWYLYVYLFLAAYAQDLVDFLRAKGTFRQWWNDQRMWMVRGVASYLFGVAEFLLQHVGVPTVGFNVTNKVMDGEQTMLYNNRCFDFGADDSPFFVSLGTVSIVNLTSFIVGLVRGMRQGDILRDVSMQLLISGFVVVNCWPIYEAMAWRRDAGRMPVMVTKASLMLAGAIYSIPYFIL